MSLFYNKNNIPILTYHSIDNSNSVNSVSPSSFKKHMSCLKKYGYQTLSLCDVIRYIEQGEEFPGNRLVITFDDGYTNNYTHAFPILKEFDFTAIIFITTNHIGKINNWPNQHPSIPSVPMLTWEEMKEMAKYGIEFGAHTQTHPRLTEVDIKAAQEEIVSSKKEIETNLGQPVDYFSYPFGSFDDQVKGIVAQYFRGAISNIPEKVNHNSDIYALERINAAGQLFKFLPFNILSFGSFTFYLILKKAFNKSKALKMRGERL